MKTRIYSLLVALMTVVAFTACDDWAPANQSTYPANTGGVSSSNMKVSVNQSETSVSRAGVDTSGFLVTVTDKETGAVVSYDGKECSWTYGQMPSIFTLPVGQYTVNVRSHVPEEAAWDTPYYIGSSDFEVKNNQVTYIGTVTCRFASIKVEVKFSEDILSTDPSSTVEVNAGTGTLTWSTTETRYGYFVPTNDDNKTIGATFRGKVNDKEIVVSKTVDNAAIGSYYIFTFSLEKGDPFFPGETGTVTTPEENNGIVIDLEVIEEDVEQVVTPDPDIIDKDDTEHPDYEEWPDENTDPVDPDKPDKPNTGDENESGVDMKVSDGINKDEINDVKDGQDYVINFNTETPITGMSVTIDSPYLTKEFMTGIYMDTELDLANPGELEEALVGFGLPVGDEVKGQTSLSVNLSQLIPMLNLYGTTEGKSGVHKFILTVKTEGKPDFVHTLQFRNLL